MMDKWYCIVKTERTKRKHKEWIFLFVHVSEKYFRRSGDPRMKCRIWQINVQQQTFKVISPLRMVKKNSNLCGFWKEWNLLVIEVKWSIDVTVANWSKIFPMEDRYRLINILKTTHTWDYTTKGNWRHKWAGGLSEEWKVLVLQEEKVMG